MCYLSFLIVLAGPQHIRGDTQNSLCKDKRKGSECYLDFCKYLQVRDHSELHKEDSCHESMFKAIVKVTMFV